MRQDFIGSGDNFYGTTHQDSTGPLLDERGKDLCNLSRARFAWLKRHAQVENQQAQPESTSRRLRMPGLCLIKRFIVAATDQQSNRFGGRHRFV
jgi:hypothetical protein